MKRASGFCCPVLIPENILPEKSDISVYKGARTVLERHMILPGGEAGMSEYIEQQGRKVL